MTESVALRNGPDARKVAASRLSEEFQIIIGSKLPSADLELLLSSLLYAVTILPSLEGIL